MKGKRFIPLLMLITLVLIASSCQGPTTDSPSTTQASVSDTAGKTGDDVSTTSPPEDPAGINREGFPIVNDPVTKKFMIRKPPHIGNPDQMLTLKKYEEMTNVKIEWDAVSSDGFSERVNLVMASTEMPDAIMKGVPDIAKSAADGAIIDLTQLVEDYAPGLSELYRQFPAAHAASKSPDGGMYSVPSINTLTPNRTAHRNLWINRKWLDALSLSVPTSTDERLTVLRAFRDNDPNGNGENDEIPMVVEYAGGDHSLRAENIMAFWGMYPNLGYAYMQVVEGKASLLVKTEAYKEVLEYMHVMWTEKLLDNAIFTQTGDIALSKFNSRSLAPSACPRTTYGVSTQTIMSHCLLFAQKMMSTQ